MEAENDGILENLEKLQNILVGSITLERFLGKDMTKDQYVVLTRDRIDRLAACISAYTLETIAEGYMGIEYETIMDLKDKNFDDPSAFNAEIIQLWLLQNPGSFAKV